jgi:hypothetical protein
LPFKDYTTSILSFYCTNDNKNNGGGKRQEEHVSLGLDLGARSNPLAIAAFGLGSGDGRGISGERNK